MFQTVRHWWSGGRGKVTARLFAFELVVVVVGVLIAQGLANWVGDRAAIERMEEARERHERTSADNLAYADAWAVAAPCIDRRMVDVMRQLSSGGLERDLTDRPFLPTFLNAAMNDESELLYRDRHGDRTADRFAIMRVDLEQAASGIRGMISAWGRLGIAFDGGGAVSASDRAAAKIAAADIRAELRAVTYALSEFREVAKENGIRARSEDRIRPIRNCEELWAKGNVALPLGD